MSRPTETIFVIARNQNPTSYLAHESGVKALRWVTEALAARRFECAESAIKFAAAHCAKLTVYILRLKIRRRARDDYH